ncbi:MAG: c-type cytochrome [Sphingomonadales bacterium]|nr:c-type cytochrome [Sphingomonadales bacterium]MDE2570504.1 c-type cytochrome [Sphingomonadales bacterium]
MPLVAAFGGGLLAMLVVNGGLLLHDLAGFHQGGSGDEHDSPPDPSTAGFTPPSPATIPDGPEGDAIRRGMAIFADTPGNARGYVGNALSCTNCHLDGGRRAKASPMWAAWVMYPQYRKKNGQINDMEDRIRGCFMYSMNAQDSPAGGAPARGSPIYRDLEAYFHWLATGAPTGKKMVGAGFPKIKETALGYDPVRGRKVFVERCQSCHGHDGQGLTSGKNVSFPPLWGPHSYNWGAGLARVDNAAAFIKWNMPYGSKATLSDQDAWDAAAYIDSQERPKDPRQTGSVAEAAAKNHKDEPTYYGKVIDGKLIGTGIKGGPL